MAVLKNRVNEKKLTRRYPRFLVKNADGTVNLAGSQDKAMASSFNIMNQMAYDTKKKTVVVARCDMRGDRVENYFNAMTREEVKGFSKKFLHTRKSRITPRDGEVYDGMCFDGWDCNPVFGDTNGTKTMEFIAKNGRKSAIELAGRVLDADDVAISIDTHDDRSDMLVVIFSSKIGYVKLGFLDGPVLRCPVAVVHDSSVN